MNNCLFFFLFTRPACVLLSHSCPVCPWARSATPRMLVTPCGQTTCSPRRAFSCQNPSSGWFRVEVNQGFCRRWYSALRSFCADKTHSIFIRHVDPLVTSQVRPFTVDYRLPYCESKHLIRAPLGLEDGFIKVLPYLNNTPPTAKIDTLTRFYQ